MSLCQNFRFACGSLAWATVVTTLTLAGCASDDGYSNGGVSTSMSVGVGYGAHPTDGFGVLKPLHVAQSVADLHQWLLAHG